MGESLLTEPSFKEFYLRFRKVCSRHRLKICILDNGAIIAEKKCRRGPRLAYMSGIHGEERSGPMALLKWLEEGTIPKRCSIWVCPLVNDKGWDQNKRNWGRYNLNSQFIENSNNPKFISQIMRSLKKFDPTVFLDLHEDVTTNYPYMFRNVIDNSKFLISLQNKLKVKFEPWKYDNEYLGASENFIRNNGCVASTTIEAPFIWSKTKKINYHFRVLQTVNELVYGN